MEAVISGQAGVALLVDGDALSSIHVHDLETRVVRRPGEFHYLFGAASDVVFIEDVSLDKVQQELQSAADGEDVTQLTLLLLATDRSDDIRETAADELAEVLAANAEAAHFAERLLFSTLLPADADMAGALQFCSNSTARDFLERLQQLQPSIRAVHNAWRAIPDDLFGDSPDDCRTTADAVFVREGVVRQFVLAAAGETTVGKVVFSALQIPAVRSLSNHRTIVSQWKLGLPLEQTAGKRSQAATMSAKGGQRERSGIPQREKAKRRRSFDRPKELSRVKGVIESIAAAMRERDFTKTRDFANDLVQEQLEKSGPKFACKSLCDMAKRAQDLELHALQLEFTSRVVELKDDDEWSWGQHGRALFENGRLHDALSTYDQAIFLRSRLLRTAAVRRRSARWAGCKKHWKATKWR